MDVVFVSRRVLEGLSPVTGFHLGLVMQSLVYTSALGCSLSLEMVPRPVLECLSLVTWASRSRLSMQRLVHIIEFTPVGDLSETRVETVFHKLQIIYIHGT
jgi:hypothetical protein